VYFGAHVRAFMLGIYLRVKLPVMRAGGEGADRG